MERIKLLTDAERLSLPLIISRRNIAREIIKKSISNFSSTFSNCIMIQGKPGTGKTTLVDELLGQLEIEEIIGGYKRVPGHVTPKSMFKIMKETCEPAITDNDKVIPRVLVLDDVDCLADEGCLELMKAAFDTKSKASSNRQVFYYNDKDGKEGIKFEGFGIIITNDDFGKKKLNIHQRALVDRVQQMSIDLEPNDMTIFNIHLIEKMLNDNEDGLSPKEIKSIVDLFNNDIRKWIKYDAFRKSGIDFSVRLIKKFVDSQRLFGEDWKLFSVIYRNLDNACQIAELQNGDRACAEIAVTPSKKARNERAKKAKNSGVKVIKKGKKTLPKQNKEGLFINPKTGEPYGQASQYRYRKMLEK